MTNTRSLVLLALGGALCFFSKAPATLSLQEQAKILNPFLKQYTRCITVLDTFTQTGERSFAIASNFDAICVMANPTNLDQLIINCAKQTELNNILVLSLPLYYSRLRRLGSCEHFDVIVAFDWIEHADKYWQEFFNSFFTLGDHLFVELPNKHHAAIKCAEKRAGTLVYQGTESCVFQFSPMRKNLTYKKWNSSRSSGYNRYTVLSDFSNKKLLKKRRQSCSGLTSDWTPGINLNTFFYTEGAWPTKVRILNMIQEQLINIHHNDLHIANVVIQGETVVPIDLPPADSCNHNTQRAIERILARLRK